MGQDICVIVLEIRSSRKLVLSPRDIDVDEQPGSNDCIGVCNCDGRDEDTGSES